MWFLIIAGSIIAYILIGAITVAIILRLSCCLGELDDKDERFLVVLMWPLIALFAIGWALLSAVIFLTNSLIKIMAPKEKPVPFQHEWPADPNPPVPLDEEPPPPPEPPEPPPVEFYNESGKKVEIEDIIL